MKFKKTITIIVIIIVLLFSMVLGGLLGAGNYSYAEKYEFSVSKDELIKAVQLLKNEKPEYNIPQVIELTDAQNNNDGYFHFYFYYQNENQIVHFFISDSNNSSFLYLDAINDGLTLGHWQEVNRDFDRDNNIKVKNEFMERILNNLKLNYKDKGNGMFVFWK